MQIGHKDMYSDLVENADNIILISLEEWICYEITFEYEQLKESNLPSFIVGVASVGIHIQMCIPNAAVYKTIIELYIVFFCHL